MMCEFYQTTGALPRAEQTQLPAQRLPVKGNRMRSGAPAGAWPDTLQLGRDPGSGLSRTAIAILTYAVQIELFGS